jgi:O-antigen/teichoic acid export membrane protein
MIGVIGMVTGLLLQFASWLIIARYGEPADYGVFSIGMAFLTLSVIVCGLGLQLGATRYIAFYLSRNDTHKVNMSIAIALFLPAVASLAVCAVFLIYADQLAAYLFHSTQMGTVIRLFAASIPFLTMINIIAAIFRGYGSVWPHALFQFILVNLLFILALLVVTWLGLPFLYIYLAYLLTLVAVFILIVIYLLKKKPLPWSSLLTGWDWAFVREIFKFSLPLTGAFTINTLLCYMGVIILGFFSGTKATGLFNAAYPVALFVYIPLYAISLIYTPVITGLFSTGSHDELKRNYVVFTRWLVFITFPIAAVVLAFPGTILKILFGAGYSGAATSLQIMAAGFTAGSLLGLSGMTLVALGEAKFINMALMISLLAGLVLSIILDPLLGLNGAALAFSFTLVLLNVLYGIKLYKSRGAHPFNGKLLKPLLVSSVLALIISPVVPLLIDTGVWMLLFLLLVYYLVYAAAAVITRSFDSEDISLLKEVGQWTGLNKSPLTDWLKRIS